MTRDAMRAACEAGYVPVREYLKQAMEVPMSAAAKVELMPAQSTALTPMDMLDRAVTSGASIEVLGKLMDLQERWEKNQSRKAFDLALANAKAKIPVIAKNKLVDFPHKDNKGRTSYRHEDMAEIARTVDPILTEFGLSYRFRTSSAPNEPVSVTCILSHRDGHSEENILQAGRDEGSGRNSIQAIGSTVTYLQRYTLKAALGLAAAADDDGKVMSDPTPIGLEELQNLRSKIESVGANEARVCVKYGIEKLDDLPIGKLTQVESDLLAFAAQRQKKQEA